MEVRLGFKRFFVFVGGAITVSELFSLSSDGGAVTMDILVAFPFVAIGDAGGMKLVILRNGNLSFDGPSGGFLSALVFSVACLRDGLVEAATAKALDSCFNRVFRSSAN